MPYQNKISSTYMVQLNVNKIKKELETMLEKKYTESIDEDSKFWDYVYELESDFNYNDNPNTLTFWAWFYDNYKTQVEWDEIEKYFVDL